MGEVYGAVLLVRTHVEDRDFAALHATEKLVAGDALQRAALLVVFPSERVDLGKSGLRQAAKREKEAGHIIACQPVFHVKAPLLGFDETRSTKDLKVLRR